MIELMYSEYYNVTKSLMEQYGKTINKICSIIANVDVTRCIAFISKYNGYVRPTVYDKNYGFIDGRDLRHPILEKTVTTEYIANDVFIKKGCNILYGINASGKSCFLRSVGISIIMAQAGMFVAASKFKFSPFTNLFVKMWIQDDPSKNQSTLAVELETIKPICNNADSKSLILTDELFSSTETLSSISLVSSVLLHLHQKQVACIFSTHLHEVQFIDEIKNNKSIKIFHLDFSIENDIVEFKRKILPGGINSLYGIEVASAMGINPNIVAIAHTIRNRLANKPVKLLTTKSSRYNSQLYIHECFKCGSTKHLHTHHIIEQQTADPETKLISNRIHKNSKFNLLVLCESCHKLVHHQ